MIRRRKKTPAQKRGRERRRLRGELDRLARLATFERDDFRCVAPREIVGTRRSEMGFSMLDQCGATVTLQWCHVDSRRYLTTRWQLANCLTMCARHHRWWHDRPREAAAWWRAAFPEREAKIREAQSMDVDLEAIHAVLVAAKSLNESGAAPS